MFLVKAPPGSIEIRWPTQPFLSIVQLATTNQPIARRSFPANALAAFGSPCQSDVTASHLDAGSIPDLADLRARFASDPEVLPRVTVTLTPLSVYDVLIDAPAQGAPA